MPVNTANLRNPDRKMMVIALAGPVTNILLAAAGAIVFRLVGFDAGPLTSFLGIWITLNVVLAVFNIMPIPPLDGSKVLAMFLPPRAREVYRSWEPYGALFMLVVFFLFPGAIFAIVNPVVEGLLALLVG
jgi:Zn-dependent protease